ncbi:MAG: FAD-binding protein, partial [Desulfobulbaceae bacterium]|nr:FAD-binding protein [Desulfobulbaceae bacterium]
MKREIINKLKSIVGKDRLTTAPEELLCYSYDGTGREYPPEAVVFPANTGEISAIMQLANATPFPVVPRGAGSGMTGGALPVAGGVVIALSLLNRILEIDEANQVAVVEPGVITGDLRKTLEKRGLYYPPDPASLKFCTMGGNVAECAGGPSAVKYGVTRDYVLGLEVVLPDGRVIQTGVRTAKGVVGYDLTRLFIGSEGTLGIISKITVRLIPYPSAKKTFLILCKSIMQAAALVAEILAKHRPCTLEYMDRTAIQIVKDKLPFALAKNTEALLLLEVDGDAPSVAIQAAALQQFLTAKRDLLSVMLAEKADEIDALWTARRAVSPAAFSLKPHKISEDVVVPRSRIPELVLFVESLAAENGLTIFTFGHAGDGNIHVNIMLDKNEPQEVSRAETATKALFEQVIKLGGTLSGEHGIGITKAAFLPLELDAVSIEVMRGIKKFFDPNNILNPG